MAASGARDISIAFGKPVRPAPPRQKPPAPSAPNVEKGMPAAVANMQPGPHVAAAMTTCAAGALWRQADLRVSSIIGYRGTAAVLQGAAATTRRTHRWLPEPSDDASVVAYVTALNDSLDGREAQDAAAAAMAVQVAFRSLLGILVGAELTNQLLGAAWPVGPVQGDVLP